MQGLGSYYLWCAMEGLKLMFDCCRNSLNIVTEELKNPYV